ncbi:MAG: hypothetical protein M0D55_18900 [Elusimicrobiota bacterium]|nr:MAG: hypothetical protein M0D55_18900 [Elusimicrobiota bacterium]
MKRMFAPAAVFVLAAGAASAQVVTRVVPSAPALSAPSALASGRLLAPSTPELPALPASVFGIPGPGVTPAHIQAVKALAVQTGQAFVIHGSRQTGVSHRTGLPFKSDTDLDLGIIGRAESLLALDDRHWDGRILHVIHGPMIAVPSVEEAVGKGHLVVAPDPARLPGELGILERHARPWRTESQLTKLQSVPRAAGRPSSSPSSATRSRDVSSSPASSSTFRAFSGASSTGPITRARTSSSSSATWSAGGRFRISGASSRG